MEDSIVWGYNAIYGQEKPEYHESFGKEMRDALNYLCARVKRSGDFWNALHTASAMYGVNCNDLRKNFEKRKKAGIERRNAWRRENEKWYAVRYSSAEFSGEHETGWMLIKETDPEKARQAFMKRRKTQNCTISIEACLPFKTRDEAVNYASAWDKENAIRQLPLWNFAR